MLKRRLPGVQHQKRCGCLGEFSISISEFGQAFDLGSDFIRASQESLKPLNCCLFLGNAPTQSGGVALGLVLARAYLPDEIGALLRSPHLGPPAFQFRVGRFLALRGQFNRLLGISLLLDEFVASREFAVNVSDRKKMSLVFGEVGAALFPGALL